LPGVISRSPAIDQRADLKTGTTIMRLTLRTLLAYLDDVLEPSQTKLMGQKIQESPVAGVLVSRIREVMRRRRLLAPDVSGSRIGIDPNIVAQYLDNTLPPEQVADVERVLLSSDELLAEVAACHQVLTLVLGEPCEVSESSRERLYALGPVAPSDQLRVEDAAPPVASGNEPVSATTPELAAESPAQTTTSRADAPTELPEYLRPHPWSQGVVPIAIVALLVLVCVGLLISDPSFLTGVREAKRELAKSSRDSNSAVESKDTATAAHDSAMQPAALDRDASVVAATQQESTTTERPDPAPPSDESDKSGTLTSKSSKPASDTTQKAGSPPDAVSAAKPKPVIPAAPEPGPPSPSELKPAVVAPVIPVEYTSNEGVILRFDVVRAHWYLVPRQSVLKADELLACLEPYEANLSFDHGSLRVTLLGDSMVRVIGATDMAPMGLDLRRGRVILQGSRRDAQQPVALAIVVGQDIWKLELLTPETICALEIMPREPSGFEKVHDANWYVGTLYVLAGSAKWTSALGTSQDVADRTGFSIAPERGVSAAKTAPISFPSPPDWTDSQKRKLAPLRRYAGLFEKKFGLDDQADQTLQALITDDNANISGLAARGLTLTDSYAAAVQALSLCQNEEGRFAARDGLHLWLPMAPDHGPLLYKELETHFPPADAEVVYRLLWGFTREDGKDKVTSMQLVGWLRSQNQSIRELAYYWIVELTKPRKWDYRATESNPARREPAVRRIEAHIERDGALIKNE
jgi:hypothetical protein